MRRWEEIYPETDRALLQKAGFGSKQAYGTNPALLIIDVKRGFMGSTRQPTLKAVEEYKTSCGEAGWIAIVHIAKLLDSCRRASIPVVFTTGDPTTRRWLGGGSVKGLAEVTMDTSAQEIAKEIEPLPSELIIRKTKASVFFATPLAQCLWYLRVDTLLVAGTSTSGCVRASVVDAFSHGFRCFVVEECVFDRFELSHLVSLFDMNAKYADVITLDEALKYVTEVGSTNLKTLSVLK